MSGRKLQITHLADEWNSSKGGLSTLNRELAKELAKQPHVAVTFFVPKCTEEDKKAAGRHNIRIVEAKQRVGYNEPLDWLSFPPKDHVTDVIIGHGVKLGKQAQVIKEYHDCPCWLQVVHTAPEELAMFKNYPGAISKGGVKQLDEVKLCTIADFVLAVGPKLQEFYSANLSSCGKNVINLTPGIVTELSDLELSTQGNKKFRVLVFGRGDSEDFELKGFDIAAKAVAELNDKSYQFIFVGAPSGNEEQVVEKLLEQGLSRTQLTVKGFIENREDLAKLLSTANVVVIPSRTEGFGLTALEALSAGLPFLVCQNSGFGEALQEISLASSWIVDSEDPKKWAEAIEGVRKKGRESALKECQDLRTRYAEKYNWEKQCNDLVETMLTFVTDRKKELQGGCFSSENLNDGRDPARQKPDFLRATSWPSEGDHSASQEPSRKKSKERTKSAGKGFLNSVFKIMRRKKSPESCENVSPVDITEARRPSLTDILSSRNPIAPPISPGYESGSMSVEVDYNQKPQEKCLSSDSLTDGRDPGTPGRGFLRATSWPPGGDVNYPPVSAEKTISFIHIFDLEGEAFKEEVLKLYDHFGRCLGYKCHLDKLETIQVAENKFRYVLNNVQNSNFVFICVSPELKRIFDLSRKEISGSLDDDALCMIRLASDMILAETAINASNRKGKFMTIMLKGSSPNDVPYFMSSYRKYHWPEHELHIRLVIEEKPEIVPALVVKPAKLI